MIVNYYFIGFECKYHNKACRYMNMVLNASYLRPKCSKYCSVSIYICLFFLTVHFHYVENNVLDILHKFTFCVPLKKDSHKGLHFIIVWIILKPHSYSETQEVVAIACIKQGLCASLLFLSLFSPKNTYSCLICMRSYCKFWNVLFLLFYLIPFFPLVSQSGLDY